MFIEIAKQPLGTSSVIVWVKHSETGRAVMQADSFVIGEGPSVFEAIAEARAVLRRADDRLVQALITESIATLQKVSQK